MFKKIFLVLSIFFLVGFFFLIPQDTKAQDLKQVTIVNPIRGEDFWNSSNSILDTPKKEYQLINRDNLPATWLVRYDALKDPQVDDFLKSLNNQQEVGLFLEITPTLTKDAGVKYNQSPDWHYAKSIFLLGYSPSDRIKLIDQAVKEYSQIFGHTPKSVGAWWIDAYSLDYLRQKYGITANLDVSDQLSTDQYSVWGQYFSLPFYPSKNNALMPAQSPDQKNGVVTMQWATRDPFNSYGNGVNDSTYSVQVNDYLLHGLDVNYFHKILDIYPQVTVGLENNFGWEKYGSAYSDQINLISSLGSQVQAKTMSEFANYYDQQNPGVSPDVLIEADNPLGGLGKVVWYQTPKYRIGWFYNQVGSVVRDLRVYNDSIEEACFNKACNSLDQSFVSGQVIDDVSSNVDWVIDQGRISNIDVTQNSDGVQISYLNQANVQRVINFLPNDISVNGKTNPVNTVILNAVTASSNPVQNKIGVNLPQNFLVSKNLPGFLVNSFKFLVLTLLFFLIPGWVISRKWFLAVPLGWVIFTLAAYFSGYIYLPWLIWGIPVLSVLALFKTGLPKWRIREVKWAPTILIFFGSISLLLTVVKSGLIYGYGVGFWGPNGHDAIWHLSLISELQRNFPPQNPVFAGVSLTNYHYFYDLLLARSGSLLGMDNSILFFQLFPVLIAFLVGILMYEGVKKCFNSVTAFWATFFLYFGGSFGFLVSYFKNRDLGGESTFWAQQSVSALLNPPFAISLVLFLAGLYLFWDYLNLERISFNGIFRKEFWKKNGVLILQLVLLWGSAVEFKVYAGILMIGSLGLLTLEKIIFKKDLKLLPLLFLTSILAAIVFLPNNSGSSSLLVFSPFWLVYSMITFQDRLGWNRLALTMQSGSLIKEVLAYGIGLFIFLLGNLGTRVIGVFNLKEIWRVRFLFYIFILGLIFPMIFIQSGTNWNIVQFFYYSILIFDIWAGVSLASILTRYKGLLGKLILVVVVLLTLPTSFNVLTTQYLPSRAPARLSNDEFQALNFLKGQPQGVVLTLPFDSKLKDSYSEPLPLLAYTSTAYVSAYSNHPTFLEDTVNLDILGIDYKGRLDTINDFLKIPDQDKKILHENNISYLYIPKVFNFQYDEGRMGIKKIYENDEVVIFKVM